MGRIPWRFARFAPAHLTESRLVESYVASQVRFAPDSQENEAQKHEDPPSRRARKIDSDLLPRFPGDDLK